MEVIPSIDLLEGRVVRLYKGDFSRAITYSHDPVSVALKWQDAGAPRIHIVDLDGAVAGYPVNAQMVKDIASEVTVPLQVGGGIRDLDAATKLLRMGVQRVIFGTAAVRDPQLIREACGTLGQEAVIVGVDASGGQVAVQGWLETGPVTAEELISTMVEAGVKRFIYTDISTDGTLTGPNVQAVTTLMKAMDLPIISSGGIGSMEDLERLATLGVEGAIVGAALYQNTIDLGEAVRRFAN